VSAGEQRILVVDDERPIRRALEVTLTKAGYKVQTATTGDEALT
jgi:DNA-binding response OmpR family regulator